jgi:hypothetical protein
MQLFMVIMKKMFAGILIFNIKTMQGESSAYSGMVRKAPSALLG